MDLANERQRVIDRMCLRVSLVLPLDKFESFICESARNRILRS